MTQANNSSVSASQLNQAPPVFVQDATDHAAARNRQFPCRNNHRLRDIGSLSGGVCGSLLKQGRNPSIELTTLSVICCSPSSPGTVGLNPVFMVGLRDRLTGERHNRNVTFQVHLHEKGFRCISVTNRHRSGLCCRSLCFAKTKDECCIHIYLTVWNSSK